MCGVPGGRVCGVEVSLANFTNLYYCFGQTINCHQLPTFWAHPRTLLSPDPM